MKMMRMGLSRVEIRKAVVKRDFVSKKIVFKILSGEKNKSFKSMWPTSDCLPKFRSWQY
jgi:hypothetical protein